ncbi:response regulator [Bradyrhizobium sp.]|uniref:response regulator n=1 Tax=Bradyrhizobium sp. TaxID=376 RepID=UPI0025BC0F9F|nr:response regulator [Bradyrhizobium sp.]
MTHAVLIVEDEIFVATDIERILEDAGYRVTAIATDRAEALAAAPGAQIALVDINLRDGMTGPAIACDLAREYGVKIFYVTANPAQIEPRARNAIGFIRKPFTDAAILAAVGYASGAKEATSSGDVTFFRSKCGS